MALKKTFWATLLLLQPGLVIRAAEFHPFSELINSELRLSPTAVSNGGKVVVGTVEGDGANPPFDARPFRWSAVEGLVIADEFISGVPRSRAHGVSADGTVVIGGGALNPGDDVIAFRWTVADGPAYLEGLDDTGASSDANGISTDGGSIAGVALATEGGAYPFKWTLADGIEHLPLIWEGCGGGGGANGISGDGRVIVGSSCRRIEEDLEVREAARWTESEGVVGLGDFPGGVFSSRAMAASHDGSVIVGQGRNEHGDEAVRWKDGDILGLGDLPGGDHNSEATGVSGDGQIIVGNSWTDVNKEGFIWTESLGMRNVRDVLAEMAPDGIEGWGLMQVYGISRDGEWIVGAGINPDGEGEGFLARLDVNKLLAFSINAGLNDAWFNEGTPGQGFLIVVFPDQGIAFLAWFTYDTERPPQDVIALLGEPGHRWVTAQGPFAGDTATLTAFLTQGGVFDMAEPPAATDTDNPIGTITIVWHDCENATLAYDIDPPGVLGEITLRRIVPDNVALCEALNQP